MPKRQTGSRSLRKREQLLDYARPQSVELTVEPLVEDSKPILREIVAPSADLLDMSVPEPKTKAPPEKPAVPLPTPVSAAVPSPAPTPSPAAAVVSDLQKLLQYGELTPVKESQRFLQYDLLWEIHKDALSTTYVAKNDAIEGFVAVRIFNERVSDSAQIRAIQKAAIKANELTHPNHVSVYENGVADNGTPYVVMDWVEGESLTSLFKRTKRLDIASFLNIFTQVCEVLTDAHSRNLYHGNLSPDRISIVTSDISTDTVKVSDFGMPIDTVQNAFYMSPEQCLDQNRVDARSDLYSLGCIMYESLVGRPPSLGTSDLSVDFLHELANQYSKDSPEHNALKLLDCIIKRCLNRNPSKRFSSSRELMSALALVSECFDNALSSKSKKLPPKAEKLLLFRFLDRFDRKITAALTAYLLLGLFATKYIGETQLQKFIDEAQTARFVDWPHAQSNYKDAIKQATAIGKPPGLLADLHWELADSYRVQSLDPELNVQREKLAQDAIAEYEKAFQYFNHGPHLRSYALGLLENMSQLYIKMPDADLKANNFDKTVHQLRQLMKEKNYVACAKLAEENGARADDDSYNIYAAEANLKIGLSLPPVQSKKYLARALWYYDRCENPSENPALKPLNDALTKLHLMWPFADTYVHLAYDELLNGDLVAAAGYVTNADSDESASLSWPIQDALAMRKRSSCLVGDPNKIKAIPLLERQLAILEEAHGKHGPKLEALVLNLANCYRSAGKDNEAIKAYERYFSIAAHSDYTDNANVVSYCDLLTKNQRGKQVPKILLKHLHAGTGIIKHSPLYMLLIESYAKQNMKQEAADALRILVAVPKFPEWDPEVIRAEQNQAPVYYEVRSLPLPAVRTATVVYRNDQGDPFGAYPAATKPVSRKAEVVPYRSESHKDGASDSGF
ncbi:MAG: serine/threonine-protein kinase [Candidatus Obscuribacterales bacterium]